MIEFVEHKNSKYLAEFMKFLAKTDDVIVKDKIIKIINNYLESILLKVYLLILSKHFSSI